MFLKRSTKKNPQPAQDLQNVPEEDELKIQKPVLSSISYIVHDISLFGYTCKCFS